MQCARSCNASDDTSSVYSRVLARLSDWLISVYYDWIYRKRYKFTQLLFRMNIVTNEERAIVQLVYYILQYLQRQGRTTFSFFLFFFVPRKSQAVLEEYVKISVVNCEFADHIHKDPAKNK